MWSEKEHKNKGRKKKKCLTTSPLAQERKRERKIAERMKQKKIVCGTYANATSADAILLES